MKIEVSEGSANQDFGIRLNLYGIDRRVRSATRIKGLVHRTIGSQSCDATAGKPIDRRKISTQNNPLAHDLIFNQSVEAPIRIWVPTAFINDDGNVSIRTRPVRN